MARKERKYHYIYKTTNLINQKYYIGMHSTDNLEDGYMGSGKRLRRSLNKYGKENFKFEILEFLPNRETLKEREKELVNLNEVMKKECLNLTIGGQGGSGCGELNGFYGKKHKPQTLKKVILNLTNFNIKYKEDLEFRNSVYKKRIETILKNNNGEHPKNFLNKKHKEESKKKISEKARLRTGEKNSQFGTCWISNGKENKKIKKEEINSYLRNGWDKGRKLK